LLGDSKKIIQKITDDDVFEGFGETFDAWALSFDLKLSLEDIRQLEYKRSHFVILPFDLFNHIVVDGGLAMLLVHVANDLYLVSRQVVSVPLADNVYVDQVVLS
jgi:hypothetical protein